MQILTRQTTQRLLAVAIRENLRKPSELIGFIAEGEQRGKVVFLKASPALVPGEFAFADLSAPANRGVDISRGKAISGLHLFQERTWSQDMDKAREACLQAVDTDSRRRAVKDAREEELLESYRTLVREDGGFLRSDLENRIVCEAPLEVPKQTLEQFTLYPSGHDSSFVFHLIRGSRESAMFAAASLLRPTGRGFNSSPWMVTAYREDGYETSIALRRALGNQ